LAEIPEPELVLSVWNAWQRHLLGDLVLHRLGTRPPPERLELQCQVSCCCIRGTHASCLSLLLQGL
jgi:hypothetical protein